MNPFRQPQVTKVVKHGHAMRAYPRRVSAGIRSYRRRKSAAQGERGLCETCGPPRLAEVPNCRKAGKNLTPPQVAQFTGDGEGGDFGPNEFKQTRNH